MPICGHRRRGTALGHFVARTPRICDLYLLRFARVPRRRTRCARSRTRSHGSAGCSDGGRPSRRACCCRTCGLRQRRRARRAAQRADLRHRAAVARVRDVSGQRTHVLADEPRAGSRGASDVATERGSPLAPLLPRQGRRRSRRSRNAALQLPDGSALHGAALVPRRRRGLHRDVDGRRPRPRAGRLRRDGVPRDGARRRAFLRPAGSRVARRPGRFPDRRQRLPVRHAFLHVARVHVFARRRSSRG